MILEYAQILCSAHHILDSNLEDFDSEKFYKLTHKNHPQVLWTIKTSENYEWLYKLFIALSNEYTYRYGKIHKTYLKLKDILINKPKNIPEGPLTLFAITTNPKINEKYTQLIKDTNDPKYAVLAYRTYYIKDKRHLNEWKNRDPPEWYC